MTDASESIDLDELRGFIHVPREVFFGYPIEPGEVVSEGYVETCMCGEAYPCVTVRLADALEEECERAESAERRIEKIKQEAHLPDYDPGEVTLAEREYAAGFNHARSWVRAILTEGDEQ